MPIDPNDRNTAYKYPFNSVKLLCLDIPEITKILFEETIINTFGERNSKLKNNMNFKENFSSELYQNHMSLDTLHEDISKEYNLLEHFFTFLRNKNNNCNNVLCGYFYQVFKFLIFKEQEIILDILFTFFMLKTMSPEKAFSPKVAFMVFSVLGFSVFLIRSIRCWMDMARR